MSSLIVFAQIGGDGRSPIDSSAAMEKDRLGQASERF
jgi:hypothetical protein